MTGFCISRKNNHISKSHKKHDKRLTSKNTPKTNEISTCSPLGLDLRTSPDEQSHLKDPPEPSLDTQRQSSVFSIPLWPLPENPLGPPEDPLGVTQGKAKGHPRNRQGPQGLRKYAQGPLRALQTPPTTPERPQGSPKKPGKCCGNASTKTTCTTNPTIPKPSWLLRS